MLCIRGTSVGHSGGSRAALAVAGGCRKGKLDLLCGWGFYLAVCLLTID